MILISKIKNIDNKISYLICCIIFKATLDYIYVYYISPNYEYYGSYLDINLMKFIESYIYLIITVVFLNLNSRKISKYYNIILHSIMFIPMCSVYGLMNNSRIFMFTVFICFILLFNITSLNIILPKLGKIKRKSVLFIFIPIVITIINFIWLYSKVGFSIKLNLNNIYDLRDNFGVILNNSASIFSYLFQWQGNVINLFWFGISYRKKNYFGIIISLLLQIWLFSANGSKTLFFSQVFCILIVIAFIRKISSYKIIISIEILQIISIIAMFFDKINLLAILSHRLLFIPAQLPFKFYEFFSEHGLLNFSHSIFKRFVEYPYALSPYKLIGLEYFNSASVNANTNFLGDSYMNWGLIGMIIFTIILAMIFIFIDNISKDKDKALCLFITLIPIYLLTNGALLTIILTSGLGISLILMLSLPDEYSIKNR